MEDLIIFGYRIPAWIYAPVIYFLWVSVFLLVKKLYYGKLQKFAEKTRSKIDDILLDALNLPLTLLIFVSGAIVLERISPLGKDADLTRHFMIGLKVTAIVAIIIFIDKLFRNLIKTYSSQVGILKTSGGIAHGIARVIVFGLGLLILLDSFGVSITPLLASLGIGSLAIALWPFSRRWRISFRASRLLLINQ